MRKFIGAVVSFAILGVIYWRIDLTRLGAVLGAIDGLWLALGFLLMAPPILLSAWRLKALVPQGVGLRFTEATKLILAGAVLNMVLPSKMGDIAKAWFMTERGRLSGSFALSLVVFEKAWDLLALLAFCAFGLLAYPGKGPGYWAMTAAVAVGLATGLAMVSSNGFAQAVFALALKFAPRGLAPKLEGLRAAWLEMHAYFWADGGRAARVMAASVVIWFLHLLQIWIFILALGAWTPFLANLALAPLAILAGLLPLTLAGIGTRDAMLILFYAPYMAAPSGAALGILCTLRYVLPALAGLPFLGQYLGAVRRVSRGAGPF